MPTTVLSPINKPTKRPGAGDLLVSGGSNPGARSSPSRRDATVSKKPDPPLNPDPGAKTDSLRGVVDQHLLRHRMTHLPRGL
jgi:hypothetical protein